VVATTAELLTTGVDVPSCRNIVFMKTVASPVVFKQIIGRGSRIDRATDKYWFRVVDFTGATRLFDQWDRPAGAEPEPPQGPFTGCVRGRVVHAGTGEVIVGAHVSVRTGPNSQRGPIRTDRDGKFDFPGLPVGTLPLIAAATGFVRREVRVETVADETVAVEVALKPEREGARKIRVEGIAVTIADEAVFFIEATGQQLSLAEYRDYTRRRVIQAAPTRRTLREIWVSAEGRRAFLDELRRAEVHPEALAEAVGRPDADTFDLLAHVAFGDPVRARDERATAFRNREQGFLSRHGEDARRVILELLEKYRIGGVEQLEPQVFAVSPFREWGGAVKISQWFGDVDTLGVALDEMQDRIYAEVGT
jgi:type I restriction enzyme R subunit